MATKLEKLLAESDAAAQRRRALAGWPVAFAPSAPPLSCPEDAFQRLVEDLAELWGWRCHHEQDSRKSRRGLPDLILVRPPRLLFAELKTERGGVRPEQRHWAGDLLAVAVANPSVEYHLWRPRDWTAIVRALAPEGKRVTWPGEQDRRGGNAQIRRTTN